MQKALLEIFTQCKELFLVPSLLLIQWNSVFVHMCDNILSGKHAWLWTVFIHSLDDLSKSYTRTKSFFLSAPKNWKSLDVQGSQIMALLTTMTSWPRTYLMGTEIAATNSYALVCEEGTSTFEHLISFMCTECMNFVPWWWQIFGDLWIPILQYILWNIFYLLVETRWIITPIIIPENFHTK